MYKNNYKQDPYLAEKSKQAAEEKAAEKEAPDMLLNLFRDKLRARGSRGIIGLMRLFDIMDDDGSKTLSLQEFTKTCRDFKMGVSEENVPVLFNKFDTNRDQTLSVEEFLKTVRGELTFGRVAVLSRAFDSLDPENLGRISIQLLKDRYDTTRHPDVLQGKRPQVSVLNDFIETLEVFHQIYKSKLGEKFMTRKEFMEYFENVSFSIESDEQFINVISNCFGLKSTPLAKKEETREVQQPAEFREGYQHKPVLRSGMQSKDNPLCTTQQYYPTATTASRGNVSGVMYNDPIKVLETIPNTNSKIAFPSQVQQQPPVYKSSFKPESKGPMPKYQSILVERFRKAVRARGASGIIGLGRAFRIADDNNSGTLELEEFKKAIHDYGLHDVDQQDIEGLFKSIDTDHGGAVDFNEFLRIIVGDMNQFRRNLVERAYRTLDLNQDGQIDMKEFQNKYNAQKHPDVRTGKKTEDEVLMDFMETFETHHQLTGGNGKRDGKISLDEFMEYYNNISISIDNDKYFDQMISTAWGLDGFNPATMPFAGSSKKIAQVNAREAYKQDHHRDLFGTDTSTPFTRKTEGGEMWQTHSKSAMGSSDIFNQQPVPAGRSTFNARDAFRTQFAK